MSKSPTVTPGVTLVPTLFSDEEEMEFVEQPNTHIQKTTMRRRVQIPHFQRAAEYRRMNLSHGTFQFAPELEMIDVRSNRSC